MRKNVKRSGLTINAVAGTHVVLLGFDLSEEKRPGCLGFAIQREDHTEDERYWMSGMKTFRETDPCLGPGGMVSSRNHPFQSFQWSDYSAKPDHDYTYTVIPLYGSPTGLTQGDKASVRVKTETEFGLPHSVFFNRGAVASQEYARRFQGKAPDKLPVSQQGCAYRWLSRGLLEALVSFVSRAKGQSYGLYGAVYEFQLPEALKAIKMAANSGAEVQIVYDAIAGSSGPAVKNLEEIVKAGLNSNCTPRTNGKIMHNKFFVLTKDKAPVAVWTGSTNLTVNGVYGHLNCGHIIEDPKVAAAFLSYWKELRKDPESYEEKDWMAAENPAPPASLTGEPAPVFSPRRGLKVLDWYAKVAGGEISGGGGKAKPLFMTFAFGMHEYFKKVYRLNDGVLRFALMEKEGNGAGLEQGKKDITAIRKLQNVVVAVGHRVEENRFDRWLQEVAQVTDRVNVHWVHTKFMLVDPLGDDPIVVTGSANFSEASTETNNENMVAIRGDKRVSDIYLGEFMRLYSHHAFREALAHARDFGNVTWSPNYLVSNDSWQKDYYKEGHQRCLRRLYFSGNQRS